MKNQNLVESRYLNHTAYRLYKMQYRPALLLTEKWENFDRMQLVLCTAYSSKLNNSKNFEPLACSIYQFMDLARKTLLHQLAKATHPHRYNTSALFTQCFVIDCHYQSKECVSLCNGNLYWTTLVLAKVNHWANSADVL